MAQGFTFHGGPLREEGAVAGADLHSIGRRIPQSWRLAGSLLLGMLAAAGVGYLTAQNPHATPAHIAVAFRVAIILTLVVAGVYAQTSRVQARMGPLLLAAGLYSALWLMNGSSSRIPFSIGVLATGAGLTVFYSLLHAYPDGHLHSRAERRLLLGTTGVFMVCWPVLVLTSRQPALRTPLLRCAPRCPQNALFLGFTAGGAATVLKAAVWVSWTVLALLTPVLITKRARLTRGRLRRVMIPVEIVAGLSAVAWVGFVAGGGGAGTGVGAAFGAVYVAAAAAIPAAILVGLVLERSSVGRGLASLVSQLALTPANDPEQAMRGALQDPSLQIAYYAAGVRAWVDSSGSRVELPRDDPTRAVTEVDNDRAPVAAVIYDATLADQDTYVRAAAAAAIMRLQRDQLDADLKASTQALAASRLRLLDASAAERQRIERDLHDGIQQHLVALRLRLEMASGVIREEPEHGQRMLESLGRQMDELLVTLRSMARGIYPSLLTERGPVEALKSAAQLSPLPASVDAHGLGRYPRGIEVAVYFSCLEALQNAIKHAGADASVVVRLWQEQDLLRFEVRDNGIGFEQGTIEDRHGLVNMRDRVEAVNGELTIASLPGHGTTVRGVIPVT